MNPRLTLLIGPAAALALTAAYLLGDSGGAQPASADDGAPAVATASARQLTMTGTGRAAAVPDQLSFALEVELRRPRLDDALESANVAMERVLHVLTEQGVRGDDVQTTGLSMDPVYAYHADDPPTLIGYRVSERAAVVVDDLARAGAVVSAAVAAGGDDVRVDGLRLLVADTEDVMAQARAAAVAEARAKAEQYAAASGEQLGEVITVREVRADSPATPAPAAPAAAALDGRSLSAVPVRAGRDEAAVTVRIDWELE